MPKSATKSQKEQFSERVKALRLQKQLSASALARSTGVSAAAIWQWEHGGSIPRQSALEKLAGALGTSARHLTDGDFSITKLDDREGQLKLNDAKLDDLIGAIVARGYRVTITSE